jgi:hypothetical protein
MGMGGWDQGWLDLVDEVVPVVDSFGEHLVHAHRDMRSETRGDEQRKLRIKQLIRRQQAREQLVQHIVRHPRSARLELFDGREFGLWEG